MSSSSFEASAAAADELDQILTHLAARVAADIDLLADRIAHETHAEMPEFGSEARVTEGTRAAMRGSIDGFLRVLRDGVPSDRVQVADEALAYARALVRRGIPMPLVLRSVRLSHAHMWKAWAEAIEAHDMPPQAQAAVIEVVSTSMFEYTDRLSGVIVDEYLREQEQWSRSVEARRSETVAVILDDEVVDIDTANLALNYDLRLWHVGLVLWSADEGDSRLVELQQAAAELATTLVGARRPLVLARGAGTVWAWVVAFEPIPEDGLDAVLRVRDDGICVALGEPAQGLDGFRRTHHRAQLARRVMSLTGTAGDGAPQRFARLALMSLLTTDVEQMRDYVQAQLGELAADDEATERLRETLLVYFDERCSAARTGRRLGIHTNTVLYRIRQCTSMLGRSVEERRMELEVALVLCRDVALGGS